jgi:polyferredoxin
MTKTGLRPEPGKPGDKESIMAGDTPTASVPPDPEAQREALRWVRRKRILYTILGIYAVLSLMWFLIDMAAGTESLWFYWPMLGTGAAVAVAAVAMFGIGGLLGADWERRQVQRYLDQRR